MTWLDDGIEPERRRIEVTVYKDGFENGLFAVSPLAARQRFKTASPVAETDKPRAFDLEIEAVERTQRPDTVSVVVKRLEPGLAYYFRIPVRAGAEWVASQTLRVDAPTCPSDRVR